MSNQSTYEPCGHEIHPAVMKNGYQYPQCPSCHMNHAMLDVRNAQDAIMQRGGHEEWYERSQLKGIPIRRWEETTGHGSKRSGVKLDIHGNDVSYRSAKARLHTLAMKLEELSILERAWELEYFIENNPSVDVVKTARMQHSATNAISLFNGAVTQGTLSKVEESSATFKRKRGRDWEVMMDPDYPRAGYENEEYVLGFFCLNPEQREFIAASDVPTTFEEDKPLPKRKRRRMDASVSVHPLVYIWDEADIDELRNAAPSPAPPPRPASVLRTSRIVRDPRPRKSYYTRPVKKRDGETRHTAGWCRNNKGTRHYQPGSWAVSGDSENADTSGYKKGFSKWERYVEGLQQEAAVWDAYDADLELMETEDEESEGESDSSSDSEESESESELSEMEEEELDKLGEELGDGKVVKEGEEKRGLGGDSKDVV
jgi:hypothetical protein